MAITITRGKRFSDGVERVYRLRSGRLGTGKVLYEHRARGGQAAYDAALEACLTLAPKLLVTTEIAYDAFDPMRV